MMINLPDELLDQMGGIGDPNKPYTAHDFVLSYIQAHDGTTTNQLLVYLWEVTGKITSRGYLYHVLGRLRRRGLLRTEDARIPMKATHFITDTGTAKARPYKKAPSEETDDET